jgi:TPR repeat protein
MNLPWYRRIFASNRNAELPKVEIDTAPGEIDAHFLLGLKSSLGADAAGAVESYRLAADRGNALAQFNLAVIYELGQGVPPDCAEATKWFLKAAEQGDAGGQLEMGKRCHRGSFAPLAQDARESRIEAYKWFKLAAAQGYKNSEMHCEQIGLAMTGEERTEGQRRAGMPAPGQCGVS